MEKLLNCPFCGATAQVIEEVSGFPDELEYFVLCNDLECENRTDPHSTAAAAIAKWNRRTAPENKPLTLEQLRQMDGEPVWVVHPNMKGWFEYNKEAGWYILEHFFGGGMGIKDSKMDTALSKESSYGRDWLAYARKPE